MNAPADMGHRRPRYFVAVLAVVVSAVLGLAGCGDDDSIDIDLSGVEMTVGSKNFGEQYLLSEMLIQAAEHYGADITDATDTGDTPETRAALETGDIDAYWEYNTTGWTIHLGHTDEPATDGEDLTDDVADADADNGIAWVGRSSFNNTYGFAMSPELAADNQATRYTVDRVDLDAMAELLEDDEDLVVCVEADFDTRDDGLILFEDDTDFTIPDDQKTVLDDQAAVYEAADAGQCDFVEVFTTDGGIDALGLELVVDPGVFGIYNVSLTIADDVYAQAPESFDTLADEILGPLSQSRITQLNRRVSEGEDIADVADEYLREFVY